MNYYHIGNCTVDVDCIRYVLFNIPVNIVNICFHDGENIEVDMFCDTDAEMIDEFKKFSQYLQGVKR